MNKNKILIIICAFTSIILIALLIIFKTKNYNSLSISKDKWDSIVNNRNEDLNLKIDNINFNEYELIIDESKSIIYYSIISDSNNSYNPSVKYKSNNNTKIAILKDELSEEKIGNYEFKIMIYNDKSYHIYSLICTKFSTLSINYNMNKENRKNNIPINIYLFDNLEDSNNRITRSDGRMNVERNDNYMLHLELLSPGKNVRDNVISIMGMEASSRYILTKINALEDSNNTRYEDNHIIELFIDNTYMGLYKIEVLK